MNRVSVWIRPFGLERSAARVIGAVRVGWRSVSPCAWLSRLGQPRFTLTLGVPAQGSGW